MRQRFLFVSLTLLLFGSLASAQQMCPDIPGKTSATHRFRREGEKIEIVLRGDGDEGCEPVDFEVHWANGRNNGSNFNITFLDGYQRPVLARTVSGFLTGVLNFPLSSFAPQPVHGSSMELISVPTSVRIEAVSPYAGPVSLSYSIARVARSDKRRNGEKGNGDSGTIETGTKEQGENQLVSIHDEVRIIGATRLPLVQIELRTARPFPIKDAPLQVRIGRKVFIDELSGDHTGRKLTLSLTPEMFAELNDGDEIVAFFGNANAAAPSDTGSSDSSTSEVWRFGKLQKRVKPTKQSMQ